LKIIIEHAMHFECNINAKKLYNTDRADASWASIFKLSLALEPDLSTTFNISPLHHIRSDLHGSSSRKQDQSQSFEKISGFKTRKRYDMRATRSPWGST
jgi:hypothetical protein